MFNTLKIGWSIDNTVIHIVGIGGIGMSGIAELLHNIGYKVQGSDANMSNNIERLRGLGILCHVGHKEENLGNATIVVRSTAIKDNCPDIIAAFAGKIPVISRSEILAEIMRFKYCISVSGSHGKTTTSAIVSHLLEVAGLSPTIINGGIINTKGTNVHLGMSDYIVAEADESDGTFIYIHSAIGVVTNIDPEHLDYYKTFDQLKHAFKTFLNNLPFYGFGVVCFDHPIVQEICVDVNRRLITYGIENTNVDVYAKNITLDASGQKFSIYLSNAMVKRLHLPYNEIPNVTLGIIGKHNVQNALAAVAIALEKRISLDDIIKALSSFNGVGRRFTKVAEQNQILFVDDYAHHPIEVQATLSSARDLAKVRGGRVIAILQPHRYTRLRDLFTEFAKCAYNADIVLLTDVYAASESPIDNINSNTLVEEMRKHHSNVNKVANFDSLAHTLKSILQPQDIVLFLGAGDITKWAYQMPNKLNEV